MDSFYDITIRLRLQTPEDLIYKANKAEPSSGGNGKLSHDKKYIRAISLLASSKTSWSGFNFYLKLFYAINNVNRTTSCI